ncbi:hypothetical protein LS64_012010, partial [Helicobacter saguini]
MKTKNVKYKFDYAVIIPKYQSGLYSIKELASMYKMDVRTLQRYIKKHNIEIDIDSKAFIATFEKMLRSLFMVENKLIQKELISYYSTKYPLLLDRVFLHSEIMLLNLKEIAKNIKTSNDLKLVTKTLKDLSKVLDLARPPCVNQNINISKGSKGKILLDSS